MRMGVSITYLGILFLVLALVFYLANIAAGSLILLIILGSLAVAIGRIVP